MPLPSPTDNDVWKVSLTEAQIKLLRRLTSEKCLFVRDYPLPEDGDLLEKLIEVDNILFGLTRCM